MLDFLQEKFSQIHYLNLRWFRFLIDSDLDLSPEIQLSVSQVLNSRHIWWSHLNGIPAESELNDRQPERFWLQLEADNFNKWDDFFQRENNGNMPETNPSIQKRIDIAFQALQDNARYLGQLELNCKKMNLELPEFGLIPLI